MQDRVPKSSTRMIRKQLLLRHEQNERLRSLSAALSRPESELVREALDDWLSKQKAAEEDWKSAWRQAAGMWADRTDLDRLFQERRERLRKRRQRILKAMAGDGSS